MSIERPTFSESWYRVADLRPRLRSTVQASRQHFRGLMWHVIQDPSNNQFFRLSEPAYRFVALLDGRREVADAWKICNEQMGDSAPTQGEAIQLLGQLYTSNLLQCELPPDAAGLFERYRKRRVREIQSYLMNLLFIRIPLIDPDNFLDRWVNIFGKVFTLYGLVAWVILLGTGIYAIVSSGKLGQLTDSSAGILSPDNLPLLYLAFVIRSVFHEFGHAFACKRFGRIGGGGGEVHVMGVMFLVFTPLPYVDASSMWAFRSKWHRTIVGAAGMLVELPLAAIFAVIWAQTAEGSAINALAYNLMFTTSVSTLLFNGNPLLRYDGYYILSDVLEIPNLYQRSKDYIYYLIRRYAWAVKHVKSPAHTQGEKAWFVAYGISSTIYRVMVSVWILLFIADKLFLLGAVLAVAAVISWIIVPLVKFARYLATSGELMRVRNRAVMSTLATVAVIILAIGVMPYPDRFKVEGVVESVNLAIVHAGADGFVEDYLPSGTYVKPGSAVLVKQTNVDLDAKLKELEADRRGLEARKRAAQVQDVAMAQAYEEQIVATDEQIARARQQLDDLQVKPTLEGTWVSPNIDRSKGAFIRRGDKIGMLASLDKVIIRAMAGQDVVGTVVSEALQSDISGVDIRVKGRPDLQLRGRIEKILPAGQEQLPSVALGYAVGGSIPTAANDKEGTKAAERLFEIRIAPDPNSDIRLLTGQRVIARLEMPSRPLLAQWWRSGLQLVQKRFHR